MRLWIVGCLLATLGGAARADEIDDLVTKGEELGKQGDWTRAIDAFKAADARSPRAKHACLIGLAYTRRENWGEAELFFGTCRRRATATDPLPEWFADAVQQLDSKLTAAGAVAITLAVDPPSARAAIALTSFAPDERLDSMTVHLAPGNYIATVEAPDYEPARREIVVVANQPKTVTIHLEPRFHPSRVPPALMIGGAALIATGVLFDGLVLQPVRNDLTRSNASYDANIDDFHTKRAITIGLFATGAIAAIAGVALRYTIFRHHETPIQVGATVHDHQTFVTLEWQR